MVPLKYLSNFGRTPEMPLINCEVELILAWFRWHNLFWHNLGVKKLLSKVPILGDILFWMCVLNCINEQNN